MEATREHPSDIMEYFLSKKDIEAKGLMTTLQANYLDKHEALNLTARGLTQHGLAFVAARNLHKYGADIEIKDKR